MTEEKEIARKINIISQGCQKKKKKNIKGSLASWALCKSEPIRSKFEKCVYSFKKISIKIKNHI